MIIDGHEFKQICEIVPSRDTANLVLSLMPQNRYKNLRNVPLNKYGGGPFCGFKVPRQFRTSGVYLIVVDGQVQYVEECANLSDRFNMGYGNISPKNCFKGGQETNCRLNSLIYLAAVAQQKICLWFFQTNDYKAVEARLRLALRPNWNRV